MVMGVLIGDLLAAADDGYGAGGGGDELRKKSWRIQKGLPPKRMGGAFGAGFFAEGYGDGDDCFEALGRQLPV